MVFVGENRGHVGHVEIESEAYEVLSAHVEPKKNTLGGGAITQGGAEGMAGTTGSLRGDAICVSFFNIFCFHRYFGEDSHFLQANFSDGLVENTPKPDEDSSWYYLLKLTTCRYHLYPHIPLPTWKCCCNEAQKTELSEKIDKLQDGLGRRLI